MRLDQTFLFTLLAPVLFSACETTWDAPQNRDAHGPEDVEHYIEMLESESRVESLQVGLVIRDLDLPSDAWVGDLGCGPGTFSLPLAEACSEGVVLASDVEPAQLDRLRERVAQAELRNVIPVLASYDDPHFPLGQLDLILIVDTYHHLENRVLYMHRLLDTLKPGGRLALLEFKPGELPVGPPADHKPVAGQIRSELEQAGWEEIERFDDHPYHDFILYRPLSAE